MKFTLLLDLDDTLLDTNLDAFLPAYFKKLAMHMSKKVSPDIFMKAMFKSTQIMYLSTQVGKTLEQAFSSSFYPDLGYSQAEVADEIDQFYDDVFPGLGSLSKPRPEAIAFVEWAFSKGWNVAIATDPLFPRKAILHRLRWAGLSPEKYPFIFISDFHNFHFAKVSVAFYPEFLSMMDWDDQPVLMVGDSMERDIIPSQKTGIPAFWLNQEPSISGASIPSGGFTDLVAFLETVNISSLVVDLKKPDSLLAFLQATPAIIHSLILADSKKELSNTSSKNGSMLLEIIRNFQECEHEVNIPSLALFGYDESSGATGGPAQEWDKNQRDNDIDLSDAFSKFSDVRASLLDILKKIQPADWQQIAQHKVYGSITLLDLVEKMVMRDREQIKLAKTAIRKIFPN
jgi:FMN phosphatase YigB (HAD superfamily)